MSTYQQKDKETLDYLQPIEIAQGIFWVGFADLNIGLRCNPYLIVDGDEAVLIDGGSRGDFSTVMMKILRTGLDPHKIKRLIYQHYDPDLCGSVPHLEAVINNEELEVISHRENNLFIHFYSTTPKKQCITTLDYSYTFGNGRRLEFIQTPYAHAPGSFMTYDCKTKTLFTGDLFGSYDNIWSLYLRDTEDCGILSFHQRIMNSAASLQYALEQVESKDVSLIAPQHGSIIDSPDQMKLLIQQLKGLEHVGFDYYIQQEKIK